MRALNSKFYDLPTEKQETIINAAYRVFSENSYKKAPMSEIAAEANISKSLLFHYFKNKKALYLFLYEYGLEKVVKALETEQVFLENDFFDLFLKATRCKIKFLKQHHFYYRFAIRAYLEQDPDVAPEIKAINQRGMTIRDELLSKYSKTTTFKDGVVTKQLIKMIQWCSEGMFLEKANQNGFDLDVMEHEFIQMLQFYKKHFSKGENEHECN
ncbi:MAG TPA: TetR/AcrR family transcriptional regulator [Firmicutes bacterium]|nr:TetR/AcrR family transcriptional regulator [Bacillota bacterium]